MAVETNVEVIVNADVDNADKMGLSGGQGSFGVFASVARDHAAVNEDGIGCWWAVGMHGCGIDCENARIEPIRERVSAKVKVVISCGRAIDDQSTP